MAFWENNMMWNGMILNRVGHVKHISMIAEASANIVPFIKAFEPNRKLMCDLHIWPTDIHIHDTQKSHGGPFFKSSSKCFTPEISMTAKWDKEDTLLGGIKHATIYHTVLKSYFP